MKKQEIEKEKVYFEIAKLRTEIEIIKRKIDRLIPLAIKQLRDEGLSYDRITRILEIGKVTALKIDKGDKTRRKHSIKW